MKKPLLLVIALLLFEFASSNHIVGGEIEFLTIAPGSYRITIIQYRDDAQQVNTTIDDLLSDVRIYSNLNPGQYRSFNLPLRFSDPVSYTNEECAIEELVTSRHIYSLDIELNPADYAEEEGYYIVYDRCCRNGAIDNINSPLQTGMRYILEIPPLWKNGAPYINSSPTLLRPLSDYACINQLYYTDFVGTDPDGDSLVYLLAVPLNSTSQEAFPIPLPKPNVNVSWAPGYSLQNVVPGSPALRISNKGLLTVKPANTGLYVFSVIVEEWRNREKIGEVQRDFQMLVVDGCEPPDPPKVGVKIPGNATFDPRVDVLTYALDDDKCFNFEVTNLSRGEVIRLKAIPVGFESELEGIFTVTQGFVNSDQDTLTFEVCAPGCPPYGNEPFRIDLIASDNACPLPQLDTVRLTLQVEPPPNTFPSLDAIAPSYVLEENERLTLDLAATDADLDMIDLSLFIPGVEDPASQGFFLEILENDAGEVRAELRWDTDCQIYDFGDQQTFQVGILAEDRDVCKLVNPKATFTTMSVNLPPNTKPSFGLGIPDTIRVKTSDIIDLDISAFDLDNDLLNLILLERDVSGVVFEDMSAEGNVRSNFRWEIDCELLDLNNTTEFSFVFSVEDEDKCEINNEIFKELVVILEIVPNNSPEFVQIPDTTLEVNTLHEIPISALDIDSDDSLIIEWFNPARLPRSPSLNFESAGGTGQATSLLKWTPECSLIDFDETSAFYDLIFLVYDDGCPIQRLDTMKITVEIKETREQFMGFLPPNVFTPNGDGKNDVFTLTNLPQPQQNLPPDNCDDTFEYISIHDRSGVRVFESESREFLWDGGGLQSGVYFYVIKYSRTEYKGYLQLLR